MPEKRTICIVTGTRADWGLLTPLALALHRRDDTALQIVATNMHLDPRYGDTWREIEACGLHITGRVPMDAGGTGPEATVTAMSRCMEGMARTLQRLRPDLLVVLGDRYEMLAVASAALIFRIPVAHIAGGAVSQGAYDESIRHAITKMSHLHLTETEQYRQRVIQLGENPARVFNTGALGVYNIAHQQPMSRHELEQSIGTDIPDGTLLCTFHPATLDTEPPARQCRHLLQALAQRPEKVIFTYPNNDTDGAAIIALIEDYARRAGSQRAWVVPSLGMRRYISALHHVAAVVGNSSSGLVEVPSMGIPTLDIGLRQRGRLCADSVTHCGTSATEIARALQHVLSPDNRTRCRRTVNPYEQSDTLERMVGIICHTPLEHITVKTFHDLAAAPGPQPSEPSE